MGIASLSRLARWPFAALMCSAIMGCSTEDSSNTSAVPRIFAPRADAWTISADPVLVLGTSPGSEFGSIADATFVDDQVAVADGIAQQVLLIDATGELVFRQGRSGLGPGEYRGLAGIRPVADTLLVFDMGNSRVSLLDGEGSLIRDLPVVSPPLGLRPVLIGATSEEIVLSERFPGAANPDLHAPKRGRDSVRLRWNSLADGSIRRIRWIPGEDEVSVRRSDGSHDALPVIFGRQGVAAFAHGLTWWGSTGEPVLFTESSEGTHLEHSWAWEPLPPDARSVDRAHDTLEAAIRSIPGRGRNPNSPFAAMAVASGLELLDELPHRDTLPVFADVFGGSDGSLWLTEYVTPADSVRMWLQLGPDASPQKWVRVPTHLRIRDISGDRVLAELTGTVGEPLLGVFEIQPR